MFIDLIVKPCLSVVYEVIIDINQQLVKLYIFDVLINIFY